MWPINYDLSLPVVCDNDSTQLVEVVYVPDASFDDVELCIGIGDVTFNAVDSGGIWLGTGITDSLVGVFDASGLSPGKYQILHKITTPCESVDTGFVEIISPYYFYINSLIVHVCSGEKVDLSSAITLSNNPNQGSNPITTYYNADGLVDSIGNFDANGVLPGDYSVEITVANALGTCGITKSITVRVNPLDFVQFLDEPSYCISQNVVNLNTSPWLFAPYISFTQRPLGNLGINDTLDISSNGELSPANSGLGSWEITCTYVNSNGCEGVSMDTIYVLDSPDTSVTNFGFMLKANAGTGYIYQWLDCDSNMAPILGANDIAYTPSKSGNYAVEIKTGNCIETSGCNHVLYVGIGDIINSSNITIYPNPVEDFVTIAAEVKEKLTIEILDNTGKRVYQTISTQKETKVSMVDFASGVYLIKVTGEQTHYSEKVVKN